MQSHVLTTARHHHLHNHHHQVGFLHRTNNSGSYKSRRAQHTVAGQYQGADDDTMSHQWYPPPRPAFNFMSEASTSSLPSNSREMRNRAEKQRRDRLNAFIGELATLVPLVSKSTKRLDKTSILRLTAVHLRLYQTLAQGRGVPHMELPKYVDQFVLDQLVCDQLGGFLLILCPNGKIIFVSHTVESLLGHLQTDLMGQSLFGLAAPEDHDKLKTHLQSEGEVDTEWRKYFTVSLRRAGPRSESPVYESVRMMGVHRHLGSGNAPDSPSTSTSSTSSLQTPLNMDILVFFVKICRPEPLVDRLVVASKDEYVTRHLIDGRIINCDQRISLIAGYMIEEVHGKSAFLYMHRDDVRWVMIALRQMYDRGESKGNSCYRLKSRNGQFIYLRTFGFLEIDDQGIVESFVCVNSLVDEREGQRQIQEMKQRYSALVSQVAGELPREQNGHEVLGWASHVRKPVQAATADDFVEDPRKIEEAVSQLMRDLPSPGSDEDVDSPGTPEIAAAEAQVKIEPSSKVTKSHHPHLRLKTGGKRAPSSPDGSQSQCKRQRVDSTDSESSQLSSPVYTATSQPVKVRAVNNSSSQQQQQGNHRTV